jgi:hypothetical protein
MVGYAAGSCSQAERLDFEVHLIACDECLMTLAIIQDLLRSPASVEEEGTLARLATGSEAAKIARSASIKEAPTSDSCDDLRKAA